MKKILCIFLCLILTTLTSTAPILAVEGSDNANSTITGNLFFEEEIKTSPTDPSVTVTVPVPNADYNYLAMRLKWFTRRFNCGIYLSLWKSLEGTSYESLSDIGEDILKDANEDTIYIIYVKDLNEAAIHREGIFKSMIGSDVEYVNDLLHSTEVQNDYYRFTGVVDELWRILGESPTTTFLNLAGKIDIYNEEIEEILEPIRKKFDGHIQIECLYSDEADPQADVDSYIAMWNERIKDTDFTTHFEDSIYIYYIGNTGDTFINIGSNTGLKVKDLESVQAAFKPAENNSDYSGFAAGIAALDKALSSNSFSTMAVAIAVLAVVIVLGGVVYVIIKKRRK